MELGYKGLFGGVGAIQEAPYGRAAIAILGTWADRVAGLEGEVFLDTVYGRVIVVLELAKLQETGSRRKLGQRSAS